MQNRPIARASGGCRPAILACAVAALIAGPAQAQRAQAPADSAQTRFDIPAQAAGEALNAFARQSGWRILFPYDAVEGRRTRAVSGAMSNEDALNRLLAGTGLIVASRERGVISLCVEEGGRCAVARQRHAPDRVEPDPSGQSAPAFDPAATDLVQVTVTGTRIRGAQLTSPLVTISHDDMVLSGHTSLGQALRALPQSFGGGQNPGVLPGSGGLANQNITNSSSANLRGLGPDATLTLLNGARMAYDGYVQAVDLSVVPAAAIDRVEVLLDGASAIYGSDAVGGVVNVILKRDYEGAEVSVRQGAATSGGSAQRQWTGMAGTTWASGSVLASVESTRDKAALASQRRYLDYLEFPELVSIHPEASQESALISGRQQVGQRAELLLDAYYLDRTSSYGFIQNGLALNVGAESSNYGVAPSVAVGLGEDWSLRLLGYAGRNAARTHQTASIAGQTALVLDYEQLDRNRTRSAGLELEGSLLELPAGQARLSVGGGWRKSTFEEANLSSGAAIVPPSSNSNRYGYAEIDVPLVAADGGVRFARTLSFNGALRHERYDSFGGETTPKVGAFWGVTRDIDVRASWGRSFKAPTLFQQHFGPYAYLQPASAFGVAGAPPGATVLRVTGGTPDLQPERARTTTASIAFRPSSLPGMTVELGWFDIDYTQRVVRPLSFAAQAMYGPTLDDPAYAGYSIRNPDAALQSGLIASSAGFTNLTGAAYDPASVVALFDDREVNAASQAVSGIDLGLRYATPGFGGTLFFNADGSWLTDARRTLFDGGPESETAGVLGQPPKFKGLLGARWSKDALTLAATMNHLGGVRNVALPTSPMGDAMTTFDLVADYRAEQGAWAGFGVNLAIVNATNQRPPYLQPPLAERVNYDSTNYSALGRIVSLTLSKRF